MSPSQIRDAFALSLVPISLATTLMSYPSPWSFKDGVPFVFGFILFCISVVLTVLDGMELQEKSLELRGYRRIAAISYSVSALIFPLIWMLWKIELIKELSLTPFILVPYLIGGGGLFLIYKIEKDFT